MATSKCTRTEARIKEGWYGVDLDGTLAYYDDWKGYEYIGDPIPLMTERVRIWLKMGRDVRIFTARVGADRDVALPYIEDWCLKHLGRILPVTNEKDLHMIELWDDRATQVRINAGLRSDGVLDEADRLLIGEIFKYDRDTLESLLDSANDPRHVQQVLFERVRKLYGE